MKKHMQIQFALALYHFCCAKCSSGLIANEKVFKELSSFPDSPVFFVQSCRDALRLFCSSASSFSAKFLSVNFQLSKSWSLISKHHCYSCSFRVSCTIESANTVIAEIRKLIFSFTRHLQFQ